jgi:hypothetical protein
MLGNKEKLNRKVKGIALLEDEDSKKKKKKIILESKSYLFHYQGVKQEEGI